MKISFIEPHLKLYGGIRRIIELANRLVDKGHEVAIFHSDGSPCEWMRCNAIIESYERVLKEDHDVLVYNDPNPIDYNLAKNAKAKLKVFYVLGLYDSSLLRGLNPKIYLPRNRRMLFIKKSLKSAYLKLSNSTWLYHWLKENMGIDSELIIGGINTEFFNPVDVEKNPNDIRILCSGRPREHEGTENIFEAIKLAKKEEPRITLRTYYGKNIPQEKMAETYSSADIFVDGRWHGGWNNPVAEAMACKVPVICTDIGGVQDFAFHEKTALLVPVEDPEAMASAIIRLIKDKGLRETLRGNAYNHIKQFSWDKSIERLEQVLNFELSRQKSLDEKIRIAIQNPQKMLNKIMTMLEKYLRRKGFDKYKKKGAYHWASYENDAIYRAHVNHIKESFHNKPRGSLLDVGCGDGCISCFLARDNFKVKGVDVEKEAIKLASEKCPFAMFEVKNVFDLHEGYDYLLASEVIEHLANPDEFLRKIRELFKKEALITTPNRNYYMQPGPYHIREYSIYEFEELLEKYFERFHIHSTDDHLYAWIIKDG